MQRRPSYCNLILNVIGDGLFHAIVVFIGFCEKCMYYEREIMKIRR